MNLNYLKNAKPINTLKTYSKQNLSENFNSSSHESSLDNMLINSNLENENLIK